MYDDDIEQMKNQARYLADKHRLCPCDNCLKARILRAQSNPRAIALAHTMTIPYGEDKS